MFKSSTITLQARGAAEKKASNERKAALAILARGSRVEAIAVEANGGVEADEANDVECSEEKVEEEMSLKDMLEEGISKHGEDELLTNFVHSLEETLQWELTFARDKVEGLPVGNWERKIVETDWQWLSDENYLQKLIWVLSPRVQAMLNAGVETRLIEETMPVCCHRPQDYVSPPDVPYWWVAVLAAEPPRIFIDDAEEPISDNDTPLQDGQYLTVPGKRIVDTFSAENEDLMSITMDFSSICVDDEDLISATIDFSIVHVENEDLMSIIMDFSDIDMEAPLPSEIYGFVKEEVSLIDMDTVISPPIIQPAVSHMVYDLIYPTTEEGLASVDLLDATSVIQQSTEEEDLLTKFDTDCSSFGSETILPSVVHTLISVSIDETVSVINVNLSALDLSDRTQQTVPVLNNIGSTSKSDPTSANVALTTENEIVTIAPTFSPRIASIIATLPPHLAELATSSTTFASRTEAAIFYKKLFRLLSTYATAA